MLILIILIVGLATHFYHFGFPTSVVFDEVFYGNFLSYYWHGTYFFDQHPPFFKLFEAFWGYITGANDYTANWDYIGNVLPDAVIYLRLIPMIAGILLPIVLYFLCQKIGITKISSFVIAILIALENSLIVQSRYILPDILMLLTGFASLLLYFQYHEAKNTRYKNWILIGSIFSASITLSIKWTGATFLFLIILLEFYRLYKQGVNKTATKKFLIFVSKYFSIAIVVYLTLFAIHFHSLPFSGKGDVFMTEGFQKTLIGNQFFDSTETGEIGFIGKFTELNKVMFTANSGMTATHPNSSKWYTWPFMHRTIFYWQGETTPLSSEKSYIYLLGNPFVYWLGTLSVVAFILISIFKLTNKRSLSGDPKISNITLLIIIGYLANLLPFALIGRVMFLYHYEIALIFSVISIALLLDYLKPKTKMIVAGIIIFIAFSAFIYWSPLTYGIPLTDQQLQSRMWLKSWR